MKKRLSMLFVVLLVAGLPAAASGVNFPIRIEPGEVVDGSLSTVNGAVGIGDGAVVQGKVQSVNGGVEIGRDAEVEGVSCVNGAVEIAEGTVVAGDVETVNGPITMQNGSRAREVGTVNGPVRLNGAAIDGDVSTYNGDVTLRGGASVGGDIRVREVRSESNGRGRTLRIRLEEGSVVHGSVIVEDAERKVEVHLNGGTVAGEIVGAEIVEGG